MSNYANLKSAIQSVIKTNGNNEITGQLLQNELLAMITTLGYGYQFMGVANPDTVPGTPDAKVFYIAYTPGTYTNFGGIVVTGLCVLKYATGWVKEDIPVPGGGTEFTVEPTDLTLVSGTPNKLKFADRPYNSTTPDGLGYKILRKDSTFALQVTDANTIYEIRYGFDLNGATINVPNNSILRFCGGKLTNGSLSGTNYIIESDVQCFEDMDNVDGFVNDIAYLHWFANELSSATEKTDGIQILCNNSNVPKICLDLKNIEITRPIKIKKGLDVFGLGQFQYSYDDHTTIVTPANGFDDTIISSLFYWDDSYNLSRSSIHGLRMVGGYNVNHAIAQLNTGKAISVDIYNCLFKEFASACIVITCCENTSIHNNYFHYAGTSIWAAPYAIDNGNLLNFDNNGRITGATINILEIRNNYTGKLNIGLVLYGGSDIVVCHNQFDSSTYAIYVHVADGIIVIEKNYFEGVGIGSYWINSNGFAGDLTGDTMVDYLKNSHYGEENEQVVGWGVKCTSTGFTGRIRPVIYIRSSSSGRPTTINNSFMSFLKVRTNRDANVPGGGVDNTDTGIDTIFLFGDGRYELGQVKLVTPSSGMPFPKTYVAQVGSMDIGTPISPSHAFFLNIISIPHEYYKKDWFYTSAQINGNRAVNVLEKRQDMSYFNPYTNCASTIGNTSRININRVAIKKDIVDGIPYWGFKSRSLSPGYGYIVFTFPIEFFDTSKFIYFPVIYGGTGNTKIIYTISSIKSGTRTNVFSSVDTQTGRSYGLYVSKMMFTDSPDHVEIGLRLDANDDDMKVGAPMMYDIYGNLMTALDPSNLFGIQKSGSTSYRPDTLGTSDRGFLYYDTTLSKMIMWDGTAWVNIDGSALSQ